MSRSIRLLVIAVALAALGLAPMHVTAAGEVDQRLWMLPPVDAPGNAACLTNNWHEGKALDWKATCGAPGSESIRFRALGAAIDVPENGNNVDSMVGVKSDLTPYNCGTGTVHSGKVKLWGIDGILYGFMLYAHADLSSGSFPIWFKVGGTRTNAYFQNLTIGTTTLDALSEDPEDWTRCWQGWHVHADNSSDTFMYWDSWNPKWANAAISTGYTNNDPANWIRRMTWTLYPGA